MNTATPHPAARIRTAQATDTDAIVELASLVDLHRPADELPTAFTPMRHALAEDTGGPMSHGLNHFLIAEDPHGTPVGAICCGPAHWTREHPRIPGFLRRPIARRISTVHNLTVHPDHRHRGIARALLHQAEHDFRQADYAALTLRHDRSLESFYRRLGYTSAPRLTMDLPPLGRITQIDRGWRHAVKPLTPAASLRTVHGTPVLTGILPG